MWISETKQLTCPTIWLGNGSVNTVSDTVNTVAGIVLTEGIRIRADKDNTDPILLTWVGNADNASTGAYHLHPQEELYLPITDPSSVNVAAEANTVNYSFLAW